MNTESVVSNWFQLYVRMGEIHTHEEISIVPLFITHIDGPSYVSLKAGIKNGLLITETDQEGRVPLLKAQNPTPTNVLLLDGEELAGAKQNRVLNSTILILAGTSIDLPVSCTEQGRWRWKSKRFEDSDTIMAPAMRSRKNASVRESLKRRGRHDSNQMQVWDDIAFYSRRYGTQSKTSAMKDVYEEKRCESKIYTDAFPCLQGQCGMIALIQGNVVSLELVSRPEVYRDNHAKMIESLALDIPLWTEADNAASMQRVEIFLKQLQNLKEEAFPAVGAGTDFRFMGDQLIGSALVVENWVVHLSVYVQSEKNKAFDPHHRRGGYPRYDDFKLVGSRSFPRTCLDPEA